jgi:fido (protein-threonine AMPylation protein)
VIHGILGKVRERLGEIRAQGVLPEVTTLDDYQRRYQANLSRVRQALADRRGMITNQDELKELHGLLFENITPSAGEISAQQRMHQSVLGHEADFLGVKPELAESEFKLLDKQLEQLGEVAKMLPQGTARTTALIRAAAFYYSRFGRIHPFSDGNGRLGRILLDHAMKQITGGPPRFSIDRSDYDGCIGCSAQLTNLAPFSDMLHRAYLGTNDRAGYIPTPFQMAPMELYQPIEQALRASGREHSTVICAKSRPFRRRWLAGWELDALDPDGLLRATEGFPRAKAELKRALQTDQAIGEATMVLWKIQQLMPNKTRDIFKQMPAEEYVTLTGLAPTRSMARNYLNMVGIPHLSEPSSTINCAVLVGLIPVFAHMQVPSKQALVDALTAFFERSENVRAQDFDKLYKDAKYEIPQVPIKELRYRTNTNIGQHETRKQGRGMTT